MGLCPVAMVPRVSGEGVSGVEKLAKAGASKARHGEKGGCLHLNGDAALGPPPGDLRARLAEVGVRGPRRLDRVRHPLLQKKPFQHRDDLALRLDESRRREVVIGGPLVPEGSGDHYDVAKRKGLVEGPAAAAGDDGPASVLDHLLEKPRSKWCAETGLVEGDPAAAVLRGIHRGAAVLGDEMGEHLGPPLLCEPLDRVAEETGLFANEG